jgi:hypothetical protein
MKHARATLERLHIDHRDLAFLDVFHLSCAIAGWHVMPRTPSDGPPITGDVWVAAALSTHGRYQAPETPGHPADLRDGGPLVDSVILMAVVQRHFLTVEQPGWSDEALGEQLGLDGLDVTRAQRVLDAICAVVPRRRPPLGARWWERAPATR